MNDELFTQAAKIARCSRPEQLAWLDTLRNTYASYDDVDKLIATIDAYIQSTERLSDMRVTSARQTELREAQALSKLNGLLSLPDAYWDNCGLELAFPLAQIALASHLMKPLHDRCQEPDAAARLQFIYDHYVTRLQLLLWP